MAVAVAGAGVVVVVVVVVVGVAGRAYTRRENMLLVRFVCCCCCVCDFACFGMVWGYERPLPRRPDLKPSPPFCRPDAPISISISISRFLASSPRCVCFAASSLFVVLTQVLRNELPSFAPYRIDNLSLETLTLRQVSD